MLHVIANTFDEYYRYVALTCVDVGITRYIAGDEDVYGIEGEVVIVNCGDHKLHRKTMDKLKEYTVNGKVTVKRINF